MGSCILSTRWDSFVKCFLKSCLGGGVNSSANFGTCGSCGLQLWVHTTCLYNFNQAQSIMSRIKSYTLDHHSKEVNTAFVLYQKQYNGYVTWFARGRN